MGIMAEKIAILIPSMDTWHASFGMSLASMLMYTDYDCHIVNARTSLLPVSREGLLRSAIENEYTHALFLDTDMKFPDDTLDRLMGHELDIVACNSVTKTLPARPTARDLRNRAISSTVGILEEVLTVGLAVMLIRLEPFKRIQPPLFEIKYLDDVGTYQGEDLTFCDKVRGAGLKVYIDSALSEQVYHIGTFDFHLGLAR